jgi:endonuclease/exonuclease/phosphatase family metal-dependent hydrolase
VLPLLDDGALHLPARRSRQNTTFIYLQALMQSQAYWLENLRKYERLDQLKRSAFFAECGEQIESHLRTPQVFSSSGANPRLPSFLRMAQWNIEKGKRFGSILDRLQTDEILKWADILVLNESDQGMNRSENRDVARDLARFLGMHMAFGPAHLELTKGIDDEARIEGKNHESLQGNAILSRYPISETRIIQLPVSFEPYHFHEKRFGRRSCLWARLQVNRASLWVGAVHLELRNTPRCRARQMRHILTHLPGRETETCILAGDLNTNSFSRGTALRMLSSVLRLLFSRPEQLKNQLLHPESGDEPLFRILKSCGFEWDGLNSFEETARSAIDSLEEAAFLPAPLLSLVKKRLRPYAGYLCFKLDWFLGKNVRALGNGEKHDLATGVTSRAPGCIRGVNYGPGRISDHLPIYADIDLA